VQEGNHFIFQHSTEYLSAVEIEAFPMFGTSHCMCLVFLTVTHPMDYTLQTQDSTLLLDAMLLSKQCV